MHMINQPQKRSGFTLVEMLIVLAIIGLLAVIAVPTFMHARDVAQARTCANNLKQLEAAKQMWGMEKGKGSTDVPADSDLVGDTLYLKSKPVCPGGGNYSYNMVGQSTTCTIDGHTLEN